MLQHYLSIGTSFDARARKCAFLGYKVGMKRFVVLDITNHEIIISRNVNFFLSRIPLSR